ncbi:unnamed protein product, partial [Staurois parvus]
GHRVIWRWIVWLDSGHRVTRHDSGHWFIRHWIVWLDSGHRVTRYDRGHWVIRRDMIIRLDQFIRLGTDIRLGTGIRLVRVPRHQAEPRKAGSQTTGSPVWILAGWYWLERISAFFWF